MYGSMKVVTNASTAVATSAARKVVSERLGAPCV